MREPANIERLMTVAIGRARRARRRHDKPRVSLLRLHPGGLTEAAIVDVERGVTWVRYLGHLRRARGRKWPRLLRERRSAKVYEDLRDISDVHLHKTGARPSVFLANIGPIPQHKPRATFASHFLRQAALRSWRTTGTHGPCRGRRLRDEPGPVAVICSTDTVYPDVVPTLARLLKEKGARMVVVAGRPGDHEASYKQAGVDLFIFIGCDVVATLRSILANTSVSH